MSPASDTFKLTIQLTAFDESLHVRATTPGGEGQSIAPLPPQKMLTALAEYLPDALPLPAQKSIGQALSETLFGGSAGDLAADLLQTGSRARQPVQVELRFDANQLSLAQYPWELLLNSAGQFLVRDGLVDMTRYINYPQPPPAFDVSLGDRPLLQIVSQPAQLPAIRTDNLALEQLETLKNITFEQFMFKMLIDRLALWGLQFNGHGARVNQCGHCEAINTLSAVTCTQCQAEINDSRQTSAFAFNRNGQADWVPANAFGEILFNAQVQFALLLSSDVSSYNGQFLFNKLTPNLILAGVPAAIGMQYPVSNTFAKLFLNSFYATLLRQNDVLEALRIARHINSRGAWYSPAFYLRHQKIKPDDDDLLPAYFSRNVDTAVPAQAPAGAGFLVRLWIRRPETRTLSDDELRADLDIPATVPVKTREAEVDLKFEPVEGRKLRRGEVAVKLTSHECEITPGSINLFVDEDIDAPAAIFTVRSNQVGNTNLIFSLWQDGGQISTISHSVEIVAGRQPGVEPTRNWSFAMLLGDIAELPVPADEGQVKQLLLKCRSYLSILREKEARSMSDVPPYILLEIEATQTKMAELYAKLDELTMPKTPAQPAMSRGIPKEPIDEAVGQESSTGDLPDWLQDAGGPEDLPDFLPDWEHLTKEDQSEEAPAAEKSAEDDDDIVRKKGVPDWLPEDIAVKEEPPEESLTDVQRKEAGPEETEGGLPPEDAVKEAPSSVSPPPPPAPFPAMPSAPGDWRTVPQPSTDMPPQEAPPQGCLSRTLLRIFGAGIIAILGVVLCIFILTTFFLV